MRSIGSVRAAVLGLRDPSATFSRLVKHTVSKSPRFRGKALADGRITLLTVDYRMPEHVLRLAGSFRRHVAPGGDVVVVQNGPRSNNKALRAAGLKVAGFGFNIGHGPALDWGMRRVRSEYTLICDPDAFILSDRFRHEVVDRLERFGVAGLLISDLEVHRRYHPICTAFRTELWKSGSWSFRDAFESEGPTADVGWALTAELGGVEPSAVLPITRKGYGGDVVAESFTNTFGMARATDPNFVVIDGRPIEQHRAWLKDWAAWTDRVAAGDDDIEGFPAWFGEQGSVENEFVSPP